MTTAVQASQAAHVPPGDTNGEDGTELRRRQVKVTITGRLMDMVYKLRDYYDLPSIASTVARAVHLMDQITDLEREGGTIVYRQADGTEQVLKIIMT